VVPVLVTSLGPLLVLLAQDAGIAPRPSFLPTPTAVAQEPRYRLKPTSDGGYEYEDTRFKAVVAPDGRVSFDDRRVSAKWRLIPVLPLNNPPGTPTLEGTLRDLLTRRKRPPPPPVPEPIAERPRPNAPMTELDRRRMREELDKVIPVAAVTGTADLTDEYLRLMGEDPYRYEKARFLASTADMRLKMAAEAQLHDLRLSMHDLPVRLDRLWKDTSTPPAARRLIICALHGELSRDDKSREANAVINTFVRTRLPRGTPDAYTAAELQTCNAGLSDRDRFDPYTPPPRPPASKPAKKR
jgi:hypothetical protein